MTNPPTVTARTAVFGHAPREVVERELAERLRESGAEDLALRRAPATTALLRAAALREIARAVDGVLAFDIGGVARQFPPPQRMPGPMARHPNG